VSEEIKKEVSDILRNDVRDPRLPEVLSVLKVDVSKDFSHAKIYYSTLAAFSPASGGGGSAGGVGGVVAAGGGKAGGGKGPAAVGGEAGAGAGIADGGGKAAGGGEKAGAGDRAAGEAAVAKALGGAAGFIRRELGARLRLRRTPELHFVADHSIERVIGMNRLISETIRDDAAKLESMHSAPAAPSFMPKLEKEWS
jgi:ribosome-binding factor A